MFEGPKCPTKKLRRVVSTTGTDAKKNNGRA